MELEYKMNAVFKNIKFINPIVGSSPAIKQMQSDLLDCAPYNVNVLATGPTGAGKELVAQVIHLASGRKGPLVSVNCAAIPKDLLEAELFGHEKGAFTDAISRRVGRIEQAEGGTLFLDEIGDMPLDLQAKLLRIIEARVVTRVGSNTETPVDFRLVCATHQDLEAKVALGQFREDLMYRLSVFVVRVPSLKERLQDIPELVEKISQQMETGDTGLVPPRFELCAQAELMRYDWPGNVRELKNFLQRAAVLSRGEPVEHLDIRKLLNGKIKVAEEQETLWDAIEALPKHEDSLDPETPDYEATGLSLSHERIRETLGAGQIFSLKEHLEKHESDIVKIALEMCGGNTAEAAKLMALKRTTLIAKIHKYNLVDL